jgi:hypothetical protein
MKTSKIIAAALVMLGFAGCKPEEIVDKPMYGVPEGDYMYGVKRAVFEQKPAAPDLETEVKAADFAIDEIQKDENK